MNPARLPLALLLASAFAAAQPQQIDLPAQFEAGKLRPINRKVTKLTDHNAIHVSEAPNPGLVWLTGVSFSQGSIEMDVRGRDLNQQSFLGIAFHGKDDNTYESVYLRPFNFRAEDATRHGHAVQYMAAPDFDWPVLRAKFPEEFERAVAATIGPTDWVSLRIVVQDQKVQVYVGSAGTPVMEVRKLGTQNEGMIGLWTGNNSDGDFANLRITPAR